MTLSSTDRVILCWTIKHDYACRYVPDDNRRVLEVELEEVTVRFDDGRLIGLRPHQASPRTDRLVLELARVFALCGFVEMNRESRLFSAPRDRRISMRGRHEAARTARFTQRFDDAMSPCSN